MESHHRIDRDLGVVFQLIIGDADLQSFPAAFRRIQNDSRYVEGLDFVIDASECLIGFDGAELRDVARAIGEEMERLDGRALLVVDRWLLASLGGFDGEESAFCGARLRCFRSKREAMDFLGLSYTATASA